MTDTEINDFKNNKNCIKVQTPLQYGKFLSFLYTQGLHDVHKRMKKIAPDWTDLCKLGLINNKNDSSLFLFEYDSEKGITWSDNEKKASEWFGKEPIII